MQRQHVKKENEGKHIAINVGAKIAMGKLFFIVDSDDALSTNAIEAIEKTEKEIAGILLFLIFSTITIEKSQMHSSEFGGYTSSSRVF